MSKVKKALYILLAITILVFSVILFASAETLNSIGDINGDGKISACDARLALRASVGLEELTEAQFKAADVNADNNVTSSDARTILRVSVGLERFDNNEEKQAELDRILQLNNGEMPEIQIDEKHEVPNYISGKFSSIHVANSTDAISALNDIKAIMNITDANLEFKVETVNELLNIKQYSLQQYYGGIKVHGNILKVNCDLDGNIVSLIGSYTPNININLEHDLVISENEAKDIIDNEYPNKVIVSSELVIYDLKNENNLVWKIVTGESTQILDEIIDVAENIIFVSATNGEIIGSSTLMRSETYTGKGIDISGNQRNFMVEKENDVYYMTDLSRGIYLYSYNNKTKNPVQVTSNDNTWYNKDSVSLMANLSYVIDYYKELPTTAFTNDKLSKIIGAVQYGNGINNAYSSTDTDKKKTYLQFGDATPRVSAIDTIAHEFTHSIISSTCDLDYLNQSGAINEAYCDILGNLIENDNSSIWLYGEDHTAGGIRNLSNPNAFEQPDKVNGKYMHSYCYEQHDHGNAYCDYGGVHTNSGIINKVAYLIWLNGISDKTELAKLFCYSLELMSSNATFLDCRNAIIEAAQQLGYEQEIINIIKYCFFNVGITGNEITGVVKDKDSNEPIRNVKIICNELGVNSITDCNGIFCLNVDDFSRQYTFDFSHVYYNESKITVAKDSYSLLTEVYLTPKYGTVIGAVTNGKTNKPIQNATVRVIDNSSDSLDPVVTTTTEANGKYSLDLPYGSYSISYAHKDYETVGVSLSVEFEAYEKNISLMPCTEKAKVFGTVQDKNTNEAIPYVTIQLINSENVPVWTDITNENGEFVFDEKIPFGTYTIQFTHENYATSEYTIVIDAEEVEITELLEQGASRPIIDSGECGADGDNVTWVLYEDGELVISGNGAMNDYETIGRLPWYNYLDDTINIVTISKGITHISDNSFYECENLLSVKISDSVETIGNQVFYNCKKLQNITLPNSILTIGSYAFYNCDELTSMVLPEKMNSISPSLFRHCENLKEVKIPYGITVIGPYAFAHCETLSHISIPNSVTDIGREAFGDCKNLTSIIIPDGVTEIDDYSFNYCYNLRKVTLSENIVSIGYEAFRGCGNLYSIEIPNSVKTIDDNAFAYCDNLTSLTIGNNLEMIENIYSEVFSSCGKISEIKVNSENPNYLACDNVLFTKDKTRLMMCSKSISGSYIIPNTVIIIEPYAFENCLGIKEIIMPNDVIAIGNYTFSNCSDLENIVISNNVTNIGDFAFLDCRNLKNIIIPGSVTSIGTNAFNCCETLITITVDENNKHYSSENGVLFNKDKTKLIRYPAGKTDISYSIPKSVTSIGKNAFGDCTYLERVTLGTNVKNIEWLAFNYCYSLTDIYYAGTLEEWNAIGGLGTGFTNATIHYNS